ncbi:hypothetical protein CB0940_10618 [Cercospora beticola]|uniref:Uncharacterized protein n=1 Tax=Cercospora beticola TaxID=122368 RepID=A0A2G5HUS6_CERBT|nr:hypothetical protein CB0940_10618 [Cercospora beticola]PIA96294.1 hypothetical protein CB0940_10618 [Cercospora beticola]
MTSPGNRPLNIGNGTRQKNLPLSRRFTRRIRSVIRQTDQPTQTRRTTKAAWPRHVQEKSQQPFPGSPRPSARSRRIPTRIERHLPCHQLPCHPRPKISLRLRQNRLLL